MTRRWFSARRPGPAAETRLVCLPYAGGSASAYHAWEDLTPRHVEVCAAELPGRGARMGEEPFRRLPPLVRALADALEPLLDRPFALFGHSMGGLVAFELARLLRRRGQPAPCHLFVSASPAPGTPALRPHLHDAPDEEVKARLRALKGTPRQVLENDELMALALPVIRADFAALEAYEYREEPPLEVPLTVFGGLDDRAVRPWDLQGWRGHSTSSQLRLLPGDHFFVHDLAPELAELVASHLTPRRPEFAPAALKGISPDSRRQVRVLSPRSIQTIDW
jgi:medium-chain acyl-[acyl-carrier-protein] hydrolase